MTTLTGDEYMTVLLERQAAYETTHPSARPWVHPLLEWFIEPGDELLFTPPAAVPQPPKPTTPRTYRTAASLRAERDRLVTQRAPLAEPIATDPAATHGAALGARRTDRLAAREDRRLQKYVALTRRIDSLDYRIRVADARETRETS